MAKFDGEHSVMPRSLAEELMRAGVKHFASGGGIGGFFGNMAGTNNPYSAANPAITNQDFSGAINTNRTNQAQVYGQQSNLANQLMQQSQGQGPNPAMAQLNQTTAQNVQNQGAMMASQRGASSNPALMARQAAMQGASTQQQAAGQAATMGAQQQLAAQQQAASIYGQQGNEALQGESIEQGGEAAQNSAITTGELGSQGINAQIATQNSGGNAGFFGGVLNGVGGGLSFSKGGEVPRKMSAGGMTNGVNVPTLVQNNKSGSAGVGMGLQSLGGKLYNYFSPGNMQTDDQAQEEYLDADSQLGVSGVDNTETMLPATGGASESGVIPLGAGSTGAAASGTTAATGAEAGAGAETVAGGDSALELLAAAHGGMIPMARKLAHYDSGGSVNDDIGIANFATPAAYTQPAAAPKNGLLTGILNKGGQIPFSQALLGGGQVPGQAKVKGNSEKNDDQPTLLSPGEVVLPRTVTMAKNAPAKAAEFIKHLQAKKKGGYGDVIQARKMCGGGRA